MQIHCLHYSYLCVKGCENAVLNTLLKKVGEELVYQGERLEIYVPSSFFEQSKAEFQGSKLRTFGLLNCRGFDKNGKVIFTEVLNLPTMIFLTPDETYSSTVSLDGVQGDARYTVCVFNRNTPVTSAYITVDPTNVEHYLDMVLNGKVTGVPYDSLLEVWNKNMSMNGLDLGVPSAILEIIISEMYRDGANTMRRFSAAKNENPKISDTSYATTNVRELCAKNSTFAALSFEDMDSMITVSLNSKKEQRKQNISPIERVIKY